MPRMGRDSQSQERQFRAHGCIGNQWPLHPVNKSHHESVELELQRALQFILPVVGVVQLFVHRRASGLQGYCIVHVLDELLLGDGDEGLQQASAGGV